VRRRLDTLGDLHATGARRQSYFLEVIAGMSPALLIAATSNDSSRRLISRAAVCTSRLPLL
jgi:hypothetical protein